MVDDVEAIEYDLDECDETEVLKPSDRAAAAPLQHAVPFMQRLQ